jgi:mRNA-degrading endonuclease RelE of RelBE toxin-antitoxin system
MDKIEKALRRLSEKERSWVKNVLVRLQAGAYTGLDIKKLKGRDDIFRVRKGNICVLYRVSNRHIFILAIERRSEKTYRAS